MKSRNKMILSGVITVFLAMTLATSALAIVIGPEPNPDAPQVYLVKKEFSICDQGQSVPPSGITGEGESQSGCVDAFMQGLYLERFNEYLFTGETMRILVVARDLNGAADLPNEAILVVGTEDRVYCDEMAYTGPFSWYGHTITLTDLPPAKGAVTAGYKVLYDKLYECVFTATSTDDGDMSVRVEVEDKSHLVGVSVADNVYFNPAISLDFAVEGPLGPSDALTLPAGSSGQVVYSPDTLKIKNTADGGVDLVLWMAGTDMVADDIAKCPVSNVIDVETWLEFRCKIGTHMDNDWRKVPNPNDKLACTMTSCQGAEELTESDPTKNNVLGNMHTAECWFRFTYPTPCIGGDFTEGGEIIIYARAI